MKNQQYNNSKLSYKLKEAKENGKKAVHWRLTYEQALYVRNSLHKHLEPEIFRIRTKKISGEFCCFPQIIKLVHIKNRYTQTFSRPLTEQEQKTLRNYNVKYWPEKYEIIL